MQTLSVILTLYFTIMFGVSGTEKISDRGSFAVVLKRQQILPQWSTKWMSQLIPWAEVLLAGCLISGVAAPWPAVITLALCTCFVVVKGILFIRKSDVSCGCIGSSKNERVDGSSVIVSIFLALIAAALVWLTVHEPWLPSVSHLLVAIVAVALLTGLTGIAILRQLVRIHTAPDVAGLAVGSVAPSVVAVDSEGREYALGPAKGWRVIAFLLPGCPACPATLRVLNEWVRHPTPDIIARRPVEVVVIGIPDIEANKDLTRELHDQGHELAQELKVLTPSEDVGAQQFGVVAYPTVLVLGANNTVLARGRVNYAAHLESLFRRAFAFESANALDFSVATSAPTLASGL